MTAITTTPRTEDLLLSRAYPDRIAGEASAVSWGAILAGAAAAAALSLILLILGTGLGLSSVSPWAQSGVTAATFGTGTIVWLTFTQLAASGMGGYLAGRLRTKWLAVHTDEVYFRDTAHGFLAWAIASLATAALLGSVIGSIVGSGVQAGAAMAGGAANAATVAAVAGETSKPDADAGPMGYFVDSLFRKDANAQQGENAPVSDTSVPPTAEVGRIFAGNAGNETLPAQDVQYLAQMVAQRTGLSQQDAEQRVVETYARMQAKARDAATSAKVAADAARKASSHAALWLFISLLFGAFVASVAATLGGRQRDL
jgi:hypothetical protein